ncbi:AAA family ATPase [Phaeobacter sp. PT47_59]|uniref:AAA family ATPase n=1 Tax=Phaeobacter sp. PT47_59 TaxID=3029979 RepID=UPI00238048D6|nr:AAA family ATPase [Phaeobacter sp. PT47_59]MDE4176261.1 AAA family ATPase [Phaeobacter sp. PT47_59]
MKIRAIRLENIRRFVDPVEIAGIGPGLNVLSAPNEQGKSTVFDALHALFFKDAKSWDKEIRALVPHAGGDPRIEVEVDHEGDRYRIAKQFFRSAGKGEVRVWQEDRLLHQADAAESWLKGLIKLPKDGGPSGLLWVRQGLTSFEDAKTTEKARRDLLSSVAGEVGMVTGGQRMDAICQRVQDSLDQLVTKRGARKGGALDLAERDVLELSERRDQLTAQVQELRQLLDQRRDLRGELAALNDPEERAALEARLQAAEAAMEIAKHHHEQLAQAAHAVKLAETLQENHQRKLQSLGDRLQEVQSARAEQDQAKATVQDAAQAYQRHAAELQQLFEALNPARTKAREARATLDAVLKRASVAQAEGLRRDLQARLDKAQLQAAAIERAQQAADTGPDDAMMRRIEAAREALGLAQRAQEAAATAVTVHYEDGGTDAGVPRVLFGGETVAGGQRLPLPNGGKLLVPGVAAIEVHPGQVGGADALEQAQEALSAALQRAGYDEVDAARRAHQARAAARQHRQEAEALLAALAPEGLAALRVQLAALPETGETGPEAGQAAPLPDQASAEAACQAAERACDQLVSDHEALRAVAEDARLVEENARARAEAAAQRLERAVAALGVDRASELHAELLAQLPQLQRALAEAKAAEETLRHAAPDFAQAKAVLQRAGSALEAARQRGQEIARDLAVLDTRIAAHASAAVEEELADTEDQLARAQKRLQAVEFEVSVLRRLLAALEGARKEAQDHYLGPIMAELRPLLRMLWPEAQLTVDADEILPSELQRGGEVVGFDSLSGGAQEQVALLVRLAFARLLARAGTPAPVILDDAIVYTDDARIEKIFDALTLQADDLQIIVFSCRQKAFRGLGGTPLSIRPVADRG